MTPSQTELRNRIAGDLWVQGDKHIETCVKLADQFIAELSRREAEGETVDLSGALPKATVVSSPSQSAEELPTEDDSVAVFNAAHKIASTAMGHGYLMGLERGKQEINALLASKNAEIERLKERIAQRDGTIANNEFHLDQRQDEIERLRVKLAAAKPEPTLWVNDAETMTWSELVVVEWKRKGRTVRAYAEVR